MPSFKNYNTPRISEIRVVPGFLLFFFLNKTSLKFAIYSSEMLINKLNLETLVTNSKSSVIFYSSLRNVCTIVSSRKCIEGIWLTKFAQSVFPKDAILRNSNTWFRISDEEFSRGNLISTFQNFEFSKNWLTLLSHFPE